MVFLGGGPIPNHYLKGKIMSVHRRSYSNMWVVPNCVMSNTLLEEVTEIKDLGACLDSLLVLDKHICEK